MITLTASQPARCSSGPDRRRRHSPIHPQQEGLLFSFHLAQQRTSSSSSLSYRESFPFSRFRFVIVRKFPFSTGWLHSNGHFMQRVHRCCKRKQLTWFEDEFFCWIKPRFFYLSYRANWNLIDFVNSSILSNFSTIIR